VSIDTTSRVLVAGAGAVGAVLGAHMARGGAAVDLLVRPGRERELQAGLRAWRVRRGRRPAAAELHPRRVLTTDDVARGATERWDAVLLCVASNVLREPWVASLAAAVPSATLVCVGQSPGDAEHLAAVARAGERIVALPPALLAWPGRLGDELPEPGIAYWLPPGAAQEVGGERHRAEPIVTALRAGGLRARRVPDAGARGALRAARTMPLVAALELKGWSLRALRRDPILATAATAASEAVAALRDGRTPRGGGARSAALALRLLPLLAPFDVEAYAQGQFSKVGAQTRLMLGEWIVRADGRRLAAPALRELREALEARAR
jgi:2-dehydropantoate 2-reductase